MEMELMALQTEKGFILLQQVICYASMGFMTDTAVLLHRVMFENKWSLVTCMAFKTQIIQPFIGLESPYC
jgi:hypothetical protein